MDKNQVIGLLLIFFIIIVWSVINQPSPEELERRTQLQDSIKMEQQIALDSLRASQESQQPTSQPEVQTPSNIASLQQSFGEFASSAVPDVKNFVLENEKMTLKFNSKGGKISEVVLKDYKKEIVNKDGEDLKVDLKLLEDEKNRFEYLLPVGGKIISTEDLYFIGTAEDNILRFRVNAGNGYFEQVYKLQPDSYTLDYTINFIGLNGIIDRNTEGIKLNWVNYLDRIERNTNFEKFYSSIYFKDKEDDSDYCSCRGDDTETMENVELEWFSHVNQFFNSTLMAEGLNFEGGIFETKMTDDSPDDMKITSALVGIPYAHNSNESLAMKMYIGPNEYDRLKAFDNDLEEVIAFGRSIFGTINRQVIRPFFNFLSRYISNVGIVIIVLIFIIKMLLYPLTYKMLSSQAKMGALKPELAHLKEKFKEEPQKQQMETMKIYREYGVSPFGGCMPMIVQMPIWYALFRFFPASIQFRQESFLWAHDLSSYDVFFTLPTEIPMFGAHVSLFTLLWAGTTVLYTYYNTKHMDMTANPAMKYVQYFMPVMFLVFFNNYASGLTCYMFFSNLINILQTVGTKKFIFDEEKIKAELDEKKKIPKKKGKFQQRLEDAMKQQQLTQQNKQSKGRSSRKRK